MKCQHARVELELEHRPVYVRHSGEWERELEELVNAPAHETRTARACLRDPGRDVRRRCDHVTHWTCHLRSACSESMFRGVNGDGDDCHSVIHTHTYISIIFILPPAPLNTHHPLICPCLILLILLTPRNRSFLLTFFTFALYGSTCPG